MSEPTPVCASTHPEHGRCFIDGDLEHGDQRYHENENGTWPLTAAQKYDADEARAGRLGSELLRAAAELAADGLPPRLAGIVRDQFLQWLPSRPGVRVPAPLQVFEDARHVLKYRTEARTTPRKNWKGRELL